MKILALLWTVCLVRLCSAGFWCCFGGGTTDDNDPPQVTSTPPKPSTPITLDLSDPDKSKINVYKEEDGVKFEDYSPKEDYHISSVVDSGGEIWKAEGANEKSTFVQSHTKGSTLITIGIKNGNNYTGKYFQKAATDGVWHCLTQGDFLNKLNEMRKSGSPPNPFSHPSTQSK